MGGGCGKESACRGKCQNYPTTVPASGKWWPGGRLLSHCSKPPNALFCQPVDPLLFGRNFVVCGEVAVLMIEPGSLVFAGKWEGAAVILQRTFLLLSSLRQDEKKEQRKPIFVLPLYFARFASSLFKSVECEALNKFQAFKYLKGFLHHTLLTQRIRACSKTMALLTLSLNYQTLIVNREWEQPRKCLAGSVPKYCFPGRESRTICWKLAVSPSEELWRHPCSNYSAPTANFRPVKSGWCLMAAVAVRLAMWSFLNPSSQPGITSHSSFPDELKCTGDVESAQDTWKEWGTGPLGGF